MQGLHSGPFLSQPSCSVMFMGEPYYDGFDTDQLGVAMDQLNGLHNARCGNFFVWLRPMSERAPARATG